MHKVHSPKRSAARVAPSTAPSPSAGRAARRLLLPATLLLSTLTAPVWAQSESPCTYFREADVRQAFQVPAGQAMTVRDGATCRWEWTAGGRASSAALNLLRSGSARTLDVLFTRMRDGFTQEVRGRTITVSPKQVQWVEGVGDKAFWNTDLSQLAVAAKGRVFYVTLKLDGANLPERIAAGSAAAKAVIAAL